jgi:hypothetical protein
MGNYNAWAVKRALAPPRKVKELKPSERYRTCGYYSEAKHARCPLPFGHEERHFATKEVGLDDEEAGPFDVKKFLLMPGAK